MPPSPSQPSKDRPEQQDEGYSSMSIDCLFDDSFDDYPDYLFTNYFDDPFDYPLPIEYFRKSAPLPVTRTSPVADFSVLGKRVDDGMAQSKEGLASTTPPISAETKDTKSEPESPRFTSLVAKKQMEIQSANTDFHYSGDGVLLIGDSPIDTSASDLPITHSCIPVSAEPDCSSEGELSPWSDCLETYTEDDDSPLHDLRRPAVEELLYVFFSTRGSTGSSGKTSGSAESAAASSPNRLDSGGTSAHPNAGWSSSKGKRKLSDASPDDDDGRDEDDIPRIRRKRNTFKGDDERLLACPFCKWKPLDYRTCHKYILKEISRLKQHLWRCHKVPTHCPICSTEFDSAKEHDNHVRERVCELREPKKWEGITEAQKDKLKRRVDPKKSKRDQWYAIFEILFPGHDLPESPYVEETLSEGLRTLQDFIALEGPTIVNRLVQTRLPQGLQPQEEEVRTFVQALFQHMVPAVLERFESSRHNGSSTPDSGYSSRGAAGRITPDGSQDNAADQISPLGSQYSLRVGQVPRNGSHNDITAAQISPAGIQSDSHAALTERQSIASAGSSGPKKAQGTSIATPRAVEGEPKATPEIRSGEPFSLDEGIDAADLFASWNAGGVSDNFGFDWFLADSGNAGDFLDNFDFDSYLVYSAT